MDLLISKDGQVGSALWEKIPCCMATSRRDNRLIRFDLKDRADSLPLVDCVYILASKTRFRDCELDTDAWDINVDGPVRIAARYKHTNAFLVYVSSEAAEWSGRSAYGDQKRHAELGLLAVFPYERLAIVRPSKIIPAALNNFCDFVIDIGSNKKYGVHRWQAQL